MRSIKTVLFICFLLLAGGSVSCSRDSNQPTNITSSIDLYYQTGSEITSGGKIKVWIKNESNSCIRFPIDFDIKVFVKQNQEWVEVSNRVTYIGDEPEVLMPNAGADSDALVYILPDTSNLVITEPVDSYALITGSLCEDETITIEKKIPFVIIP